MLEERSMVMDTRVCPRTWWRKKARLKNNIRGVILFTLVIYYLVNFKITKSIEHIGRKNKTRSVT